MEYKEYIKHVNPIKFEYGNYGKWVRFTDSFTPVDIDKPYNGILIEILLNNGNPVYQSVFSTKEKEVAFRDYDINQEILSYGEYDGLYWRFIPDPPEDRSYDVG